MSTANPAHAPVQTMRTPPGNTSFVVRHTIAVSTPSVRLTLEPFTSSSPAGATASRGGAQRSAVQSKHGAGKRSQRQRQRPTNTIRGRATGGAHTEHLYVDRDLQPEQRLAAARVPFHVQHVRAAVFGAQRVEAHVHDTYSTAHSTCIVRLPVQYSTGSRTSGTAARPSVCRPAEDSGRQRHAVPECDAVVRRDGPGGRAAGHSCKLSETTHLASTVQYCTALRVARRSRLFSVRFCSTLQYCICTVL